MPGFDGTGPMGFGPRTGGGFGFCAPGAGAYPAYTNVVYGVGRGGIPYGGGRGLAYGGGRGRGRGFWRRGFVPVAPVAPTQAQWSQEDELAYLQDQAQAIQDQLAQINARITELTKEKA